MAYAIYDFDIDQGSTFGVDLTFKDADGTVRNLEDYTATMHLRTSFDEPDTTDIWNSGHEITLSATEPNIRLTVSASQTASYPVGSYEYDLEIEQVGVVEKVLQGKINVTNEATK